MTIHTERLIKKNISLPDRRTSVQLEGYVWQSIDAILSMETITLPLLCAELDQRRGDVKLASSMRLFALIYYRTLSNYFHEETGERDMLQGPKSAHFNCFWTSLQQFSKYAQHASEPDQKKPSPLLSEIQNLPRQLSSLP